MVNRKLWGLTLLERNLRELERLGYRHIYLATAPGIDPLAHFCHPQPASLTITVDVVTGENLFHRLEQLLEKAPQGVLVLDGHALNDRRLLTRLTAADDALAVFPDFGNNPGALARLTPATASILQQSGAADLKALLTDAVAAKTLKEYDLATFNPYIENLRREVPPYVLRIENDSELLEAENVLKQTVHKGVLEFVAKYIHPPLEFGTVKLIAESEITPNQITIFWLILAGLTVPLFMKGYLLIGIILAAISGVLDGVDGKLARLTLRYSKTGDRLDHVGGTIYDAIWYVALGYYFSDGNLHSTGAQFSLLLLISYMLHRIVPGLFRAVHGHEIYDFGKIDVFMRLIGARMNNNIWLFLVGVLLGYPREIYYLMCIWMAVTAVWYVVRFLWVSLGNLVSQGKVQVSQ